METTRDRLKLDRAHRALAPRPDPNQRPRPLIIKFHNFTDKCCVMEAAWRIGSRRRLDQEAPENPRISFFNDYSAEVVRRRKAFDGLKARLRKINLDYSLMYPATLRVKVNGKQGDLIRLGKLRHLFALWNKTVMILLLSDSGAHCAYFIYLA